MSSLLVYFSLPFPALKLLLVYSVVLIHLLTGVDTVRTLVPGYASKINSFNFKELGHLSNLIVKLELLVCTQFWV